jgi:hypothetical protein
LLVVSLALMLSPSSAIAQEDTDARVELVVVGEARQLLALQASVGRGPGLRTTIAWFLTPRLTRSEVLRVAGAGAQARCFIDLSALPKARLYFADRTAQRFLIREVTLEPSLDEMSRETLAQIIESSLDALLDPSAVMLTREQLSQELARGHEAEVSIPTVTEPAKLPVAARYRVDWQLLYSAGTFADTPSVAHGPGLGASFGSDRDLRLSAWVTIQYQLPQTFQNRLIGARLQGVPLRAGVGIETSLLSAFRLGARAGIGVDFVHLSPRQGTSNRAILTEARWTGVTAASALLDLKLMLSARTALCLSPLLDLDIEPRHYDATVNGQRVAVLEPAAVRAGVALAAVSAF